MPKEFVTGDKVAWWLKVALMVSACVAGLRLASAWIDSRASIEFVQKAVKPLETKEHAKEERKEIHKKLDKQGVVQTNIRDNVIRLLHSEDIRSKPLPKLKEGD